MIGVISELFSSVHWGQIIWSGIWAIRQCYQPIKFHAGHSVLQDPNLYLRCCYLTKYDLRIPSLDIHHHLDNWSFVVWSESNSWWSAIVILQCYNLHAWLSTIYMQPRFKQAKEESKSFQKASLTTLTTAGFKKVEQNWLKWGGCSNQYQGNWQDIENKNSWKYKMEEARLGLFWRKPWQIGFYATLLDCCCSLLFVLD